MTLHQLQRLMIKQCLFRCAECGMTTECKALLHKQAAYLRGEISDTQLADALNQAWAAVTAAEKEAAR